jgi:hypothetical protein
MIRTLPLFAIVLNSVLGLAQTDIQAVLDNNKSAIGLSAEDLAEYAVTNAYQTKHLGVMHVYLEQRHKDIRVYNGILNLNLAGDKLLSFGNRWVTAIAAHAPSNIPQIDARTAIERAADHLGQKYLGGNEIRREQNTLGQDTKLFFERGTLSLENINAELVWHQGDQKDVLLCWIVEIYQVDAEHVWHILIDAHTGAFVRKDNLVKHCEFGAPCIDQHPLPFALSSMPSLAPDSSYNVFAMPVESPNHGDRSIAVTPWHDAGSGNAAVTLGWHSNGTTNYTITRGNNVHAYEDIDNNGSPGFNPDTSNLRFDYPFDPILDPEDNMAAAVTNLFYWNNIIHDVMYQYGFDEPSGNFQVNNLGRGGNGGDDVRAEALDGGGTNNANFFTPTDGSRPRMQMYLWSTVSESSPLTVNSPEQIIGDIYAVQSAFSNKNSLEENGLTTGDNELVEDTGADTQ